MRTLCIILLVFSSNIIDIISMRDEGIEDEDIPEEKLGEDSSGKGQEKNFININFSPEL